MSHSDVSSVPSVIVSGGPGGPGGPGDLVLEAADGTRFAAYAARAPRGSGRGVVILPDARGLHRFYKQLADRFAEEGVDAVAIDYLERTSGSSSGAESSVPLADLERTTPDGVASDVAAAAHYLRSLDGGADTAIFTLGFAVGGRYSLRQAAEQLGLAGAIGFCSHPSMVAAVVDTLHAPMLLLLAGGDASVPLVEAESFAAAAEQRGVPCQLVLFPGVPAGFFDHYADEYPGVSEQAWRHVRTFMDRYA